MSTGHPHRPRAHCATLGVRRTSDRVLTDFEMLAQNADALTRKLDLQDFQREAYLGVYKKKLTCSGWTPCSRPTMRIDSGRVLEHKNQ